MNLEKFVRNGQAAQAAAHAEIKKAEAKEEKPAPEAEQLKLAKAAVSHVLNALADDPRKFWLMGDMTGSYEKLLAAAHAIWGTSIEKLKADFRPRKDEWERYCAEKEAEERLLNFCRENGITGRKS